MILLTDYIVDENVILDAWRGKRFDSYAGAEKQFITSFFRSAHRLAYDEEIKQKIIRMRKVTFKDNEFLDNSVVPMLTKLIHDSSRAIPYSGIKTDFQGVKKCDKHFVGVTLQSQGILVTNDEKLRKAITDDPVVSKCRHMTPEDALGTI